MSKIFGTPKSEGTYSEISQSNPLRWVILKKVDGGFEVASAVFKCKDFFNDVVASYHGRNFGIYGFNAGEMPKYDEGVYVELKNITNFEVFEKNIGSINNLTGADVAVPLEKIDEHSAVALLPRAYFNSTWAISLLTYLIRVSNTNTVIEDWTKHPTKGVDNPFGKYHDQVIGFGFKLPVVTPHYLYLGPKGGDAEKQSTYTIHNNGCCNWMTMKELAGV